MNETIFSREKKIGKSKAESEDKETISESGGSKGGMLPNTLQYDTKEEQKKGASFLCQTGSWRATAGLSIVSKRTSRGSHGQKVGKNSISREGRNSVKRRWARKARFKLNGFFFFGGAEIEKRERRRTGA